MAHYQPIHLTFRLLANNSNYEKKKKKLSQTLKSLNWERSPKLKEIIGTSGRKASGARHSSEALANPIWKGFIHQFTVEKYCYCTNALKIYIICMFFVTIFNLKSPDFSFQSAADRGGQVQHLVVVRYYCTTKTYHKKLYRTITYYKKILKYCSTAYHTQNPAILFLWYCALEITEDDKRLVSVIKISDSFNLTFQLLCKIKYFTDRQTD